MQIQVQGQSFDFDALDADVMGRYENALEEMSKASDKLHQKSENKQKVKLSELIREECQIIFTMMDTVLGEGASNLIFGGKTSLNICLDAVEELINGAAQSQKLYTDRVKDYSPDRLKKKS